MSLTRHCRALACPRRVAHTVLFCDVHFRQLPDKYRRPIYLNRDVPTRATISDAQRTVSATRRAITYLAGKEGRRQEYLQLQKEAASSPPPPGPQQEDAGGSGSGAVATATGGSLGSTRTGRQFQEGGTINEN